jgi:hypothetical protein
MMMTPDQFKEIEESIKSGIQITAEQARLLIDTVSRLDGPVAVFQNSLQLMADGVASAVPELANKVMQRCGRTEKKVVKSVAEMAATTIMTIESGIQSYLIQCMMQLAESLGVSLEELINGNQEDESTSETSSQELQA